MPVRRTGWSKYVSPVHFCPLADRIIPWLAGVVAMLFAVGIIIGFAIAPTDFQQGEAYRVLFIHVPAAWLGMFLYVLLAVYAAIGWVFNARVPAAMAASLARTGALFTILALVTGSLWGRPTWGTWWVWDARTTSTLILLFLYIGFIALQSSIDDPRRADRAGAVLAVAGVVNVPVIYFSVQWWSTLHQGASIRIVSNTTMDPSMLAAMLVMSAACWLYAVAVVLARASCVIVEREQSAHGLEFAHER